jgi:hypothetical protein
MKNEAELRCTGKLAKIAARQIAADKSIITSYVVLRGVLIEAIADDPSSKLARHINTVTTLDCKAASSLGGHSVTKLLESIMRGAQHPWKPEKVAWPRGEADVFLIFACPSARLATVNKNETVVVDAAQVEPFIREYFDLAYGVKEFALNKLQQFKEASQDDNSQSQSANTTQTTPQSHQNNSTARVSQEPAKSTPTRKRTAHPFSFLGGRSIVTSVHYPDELNKQETEEVTRFETMNLVTLNKHLTNLVKENGSEALRMRGEILLHYKVVEDARTTMPLTSEVTLSEDDRWPSLENKSEEEKQRVLLLQQVFSRFSHRWTTDEKNCFFLSLEKVKPPSQAINVSNDALVRYMNDELESTDEKRYQLAQRFNCWVKGYILLVMYGATKLGNSRAGLEFMQRYGWFPDLDHPGPDEEQQHRAARARQVKATKELTEQPDENTRDEQTTKETTHEDAGDKSPARKRARRDSNPNTDFNRADVTDHLTRTGDREQDEAVSSSETQIQPPQPPALALPQALGLERAARMFAQEILMAGMNIQSQTANRPDLEQKLDDAVGTIKKLEKELILQRNKSDDAVGMIKKLEKELILQRNKSDDAVGMIKKLEKEVILQRNKSDELEKALLLQQMKSDDASRRSGENEKKVIMLDENMEEVHLEVAKIKVEVIQSRLNRNKL